MAARLLAGGLILALALIIIISWQQSKLASATETALDRAMLAAMEDGRGRMFFQDFPKGADLHNHLTGAIYAETWLDWAVEDGLCVDPEVPAIRDPGNESCRALALLPAAEARANEAIRRAVINGLSMRSFVPTSGFSGHNQFFVTFSRMARKPGRLGDMLAAALDRAGHQNIVYLELMETPLLPELFPLLSGVELSGDPAADYKLLMGGAFGQQFGELVALAKTRFSEARARANRLLGCNGDNPSPGCNVEIRWLYQVIREFEPAMVYGQFILGWEVIKGHDDVVGLNLVAPEDGYVALRDYTQHMRQIGYLQESKGRHNVALHAGELTLGLVRPKQLRFHIREAIDIAGAKRIGHGIDIPFERDAKALLNQMARDNILVEINLTSNDVILGVKGSEHPLGLYREAGVPFALSTDDEGVSRIDLTHEYRRAAREQGLDYDTLKQASRDSLTYSFLPGESLWDTPACVARADKKAVKNAEELMAGNGPCAALLQGSLKARKQWDLEQRFQAFEQAL